MTALVRSKLTNSFYSGKALKNWHSISCAWSKPSIFNLTLFNIIQYMAATTISITISSLLLATLSRAYNSKQKVCVQNDRMQLSGKVKRSIIYLVSYSSSWTSPLSQPNSSPQNTAAAGCWRFIASKHHTQWTVKRFQSSRMALNPSRYRRTNAFTCWREDTRITYCIRNHPTVAGGSVVIRASARSRLKRSPG